MWTIQIRIDLMHFYIHIRCSIVVHIINQEQKTKQNGLFMEPGLQCKANTCLLPPQFYKEENLEVVKKERLPLSLQARLGLQKCDDFAKKPS